MIKIFTHTIYVITISLFLLLSKTEATRELKGNNMEKNIKQINVKDIDGKTVDLASYKGKVLLIVNVASYCGYTKQYSGLEEIYKKYKSKGFEILAFLVTNSGNRNRGRMKK